MTPSLQQSLFNKYPKLFAQRDLPMTQTCMCWGIECGDGWYGVIDRMCEKLAAYDVELVQLKEKFAGLRAYTSSYPTDDADAIDDITETAEEESLTVCEACGQPGTLRTGGWLVTACDECHGGVR